MSLSKEANERLWDAVIKEALIISIRNEINDSEEIEPFNPSQHFEKKMRKLIKNIGRKEHLQAVGKNFTRLIVTAAVIMGIAFGGLLTQHDVYAAVENVIRNIFSDHDKITFRGDEAEFDDTIRFGYIPSGYELRSVVYMGNSMLITYESNNGENIYFNYSVADGSALFVDNETHDYEEITVNGTVYHYYNSTDGRNIIIWSDYIYAYSIEGQISKEEFVEIAENINFEK